MLIWFSFVRIWKNWGEKVELKILKKIYKFFALPFEIYRERFLVPYISKQNLFLQQQQILPVWTMWGRKRLSSGGAAVVLAGLC